MKIRANLPLAMLLAAAAGEAACTSISQEQLIQNEQSRLRQEQQGYFDRESGQQQRKADEEARQEQLRRKG